MVLLAALLAAPCAARRPAPHRDTVECAPGAAARLRAADSWPTLVRNDLLDNGRLDASFAFVGAGACAPMHVATPSVERWRLAAASANASASPQAAREATISAYESAFVSEFLAPLVAPRWPSVWTHARLKHAPLSARALAQCVHALALAPDGSVDALDVDACVWALWRADVHWPHMPTPGDADASPRWATTTLLSAIVFLLVSALARASNAHTAAEWQDQTPV